MQIPTFLGVSWIILFELHGVGLSTFLMMPAFSYLWRPLFSTAPFATGMWRMAIWMGVRPGLMVKCTGRPQPTDARGRVTLTIVPVGPGCHQGRMQSLWVHPCWVGGGIRLHHIFNCFPSCRAGSWEFWCIDGVGEEILVMAVVLHLPSTPCWSGHQCHTLSTFSLLPDTASKDEVPSGHYTSDRWQVLCVVLFPCLTQWTCSSVVDFVEPAMNLFVMLADSNASVSVTTSTMNLAVLLGLRWV